MSLTKSRLKIFITAFYQKHLALSNGESVYIRDSDQGLNLDGE